MAFTSKLSDIPQVAYVHILRLLLGGNFKILNPIGSSLTGPLLKAEIRERRPSRGELPCRVTDNLIEQLPRLTGGLEFSLTLITPLELFFLVIFLFQLFCQVRIAHAVHIRYSVPNQLIDLGMVEEVQCRIQRDTLLFGKALNHTAIFFLKQNPVCVHTSTPLSFITVRRSSTIYSRLWVCSISYSGTM